MATLRNFILMVVVAVLAVSCSAGFEPEPLPEPAAVTAEGTERDAGPEEAADPSSSTAPRLTPAVLDLSSADLVDGPLNEAQYAAVTAWFDSFLQARDLFFVGQATAADLGAFTSDRAFLAETTEFQQEYLKLLEAESVIATTDFASFSNLTSSQITRGAIVFEDCTEQQSLSTIGIVGFRWIQNRIVLREIDGAWTMADVEIVHDGFPWTEGYGCSPPSFNERAATIAEELMLEYQRYQQDPYAMGDGAFSIVADPVARVLFQNAIKQQQDEDIAVVSPEELRFEVLGLDVDGSLVDWAVVVEACSHRPEGLSYSNADGEIEREETVEDGFSLAYRFVVSLEAVEADATSADVVRVVELGEQGCW